MIARKRKRLLGLDATCNVPPDALNFRSTIATNGDLSPGYPAYTVIRFNLFVVHPGPIGLDGNDTAVTNGHLCCATDQNLMRLARKLAERIVCVSNPARTVAPDDNIALCLQQAARSLFCFSHLPEAVRQVFDSVLEHALAVFGRAISCVDECRQDAGDQGAGGQNVAGDMESRALHGPSVAGFAIGSVDCPRSEAIWRRERCKFILN